MLHSQPPRHLPAGIVPQRRIVALVPIEELVRAGIPTIAVETSGGRPKWCTIGRVWVRFSGSGTVLGVGV